MKQKKKEIETKGLALLSKKGSYNERIIKN